MNPPWVYMCSPSWIPLLPSSPFHPSGSSQCTSPEHPVSCIEPGLVIHFTYDNIHVSMLFSHVIPPSPSPTESKRLFYTSLSLLLSLVHGYHYHLSNDRLYPLGFISKFCMIFHCEHDILGHNFMSFAWILRMSFPYLYCLYGEEHPS